MIWNRFDIVMAHYLYCSNWHGGQGSPEHARLCRISRYFSPGLSFPAGMSENARAIYRDLVVQNHGPEADTSLTS